MGGAAQRLAPLYRCVNRPVDFQFADWLMLFSLTLQYRPELIVEVGRGCGNSTCVFLEAASELSCPVVSVDRRSWRWRRTAKKVLSLRGRDWLCRGTIVSKNFLATDPQALIPEGTGRTLFFWDAHGRDLATFIIRRIFPRLRVRSHLIIVHDITDLLLGLNPRHFQQGPFNSGFDELFPLYELWQAENTAVRSPARDIAGVEKEDPNRVDRLAGSLPVFCRPLLGPTGHWVYFQLSPSLTMGPDTDAPVQNHSGTFGLAIKRFLKRFQVRR